MKKQNIIIQSSFGTIELSDNYGVITANEGTQLQKKEIYELTNIFLNHYKNEKPVGYISNRINSYSVNPLDCLKFFEDVKIFAVAAVVKGLAEKIATIEKTFYSFKVKSFYSLDDAKKYMDDYNLNKRKNK